MAAKRLFILTGDYSGDVHAANVVKELRRLQPDIEIAAVGGPNLQALEGVQLISDQSGMGRVGFGSVLGAPYHYFLGKKIIRFLDTFHPDAVLLIDYGGFNLLMAKTLKAKGWKVLYFIPPQVWASRKGRINRIKVSVDHVFCIFPFEEAIYREQQIPVTYVGHPLVGQLPPPEKREAFCQRHGLNPEKSIIGLLPGSRKVEIDYLLKEMVGSSPKILRKCPDAEFVIAKAASLGQKYFDQKFQQAVRHLPQRERKTIRIVNGENHAVLSVSDAVIAASGTVTLEAALYNTPMVITYKLNPIIWAIGSRMMYLPCIGLPNILLDPNNPGIPECLQDKATPNDLAEALLPLLDRKSPEARRQMEGFAQIRRMLSQGGAAANVAKGILREIGAADFTQSVSWL
jgi:lipid-A-disaccharide synthase